MEFSEIIKGFKAKEGGKRVGQIDFNIHDGVMRITHTEVDENHQGKGIATELVLRAVAYARLRDLKVLPLCAVAAHVLKKEEFSDILA